MKGHLEYLANELIHEIFDYLSISDLFNCFNQLNKRFSQLISQQIFKCDFSHLSKNDFENLLYILPFNQINALKISNRWTINIFSRISFHLMTNLRILTLSHINYNEIRSLFESKQIFSIFQQLNTLKIQSTNLNSLDRERLFVLKKLFSQMPKLRCCQIPLIDVHDLDDLMPTFTLEHLIIDYCTMICLGRLLNYIPNVRSLTVCIYNDLLQTFSNSILLKSSYRIHTNIRLLNLSTINNLPFNQIENFFQNYSFNYLEKFKFLFKTDALTQSCLDYLNDKRWEYLLQRFLSLENFACSIEFPIQSGDVIINTFEQNPFFLKHHWNFSIQTYTYSYNTILRLHTKPYPKRRLDIIPSKAFVDNINNIYFRVRDLRILIDTIPLIKSSGSLYENALSLSIIANKTFNEHTFLNYLYSIINRNQIKYLTIQLDNCSAEFLSNIFENLPRLYSLTISTYHSWPKLLQLSRKISSTTLRSLIIYENFIHFNQYENIHLLIKQLEILSITVPSIDDCYRLLTLLFIGHRKKPMEKLRSLTIKCDFNEPDAIANWIRTNIARKLSYKCTTSVLSIWL